MCVCVCVETRKRETDFGTFIKIYFIATTGSRDVVSVPDLEQEEESDFDGIILLLREMTLDDATGT